ncbi:MAG: serine hydrolase [bacterium]
MTIRARSISIVAIIMISCGFLIATNSKSANLRLLNNQTSIPLSAKNNLPNNQTTSYELERVENYYEPTISASGAIAVYIDETNKVSQVLFEKNADRKLPIASITKLMTALIVLDNYSIDTKITITQKATSQKDNNGKLKAKEEFTIGDLLYPMLVESDNGVAYVLAEKDGADLFIKKMNDRAKDIGLNSTIFFNPTGLDPDNSKKIINQSTARDIYLLTTYLLDKPLIWEVLKTSRINFYSSGNVFHHEIISTNEFLENRPVLWKDRVIGGKTGWTIEANGCLMLVVNTQSGQGKIIAVILGADDRFKEMEKLIDWVFSNYR